MGGSAPPAPPSAAADQPAEAAGQPAKALLSSRLLGMAFMRRGAGKVRAFFFFFCFVGRRPNLPTPTPVVTLVTLTSPRLPPQKEHTGRTAATAATAAARS
jgi:hypothetical protein